MMLLRRSLPCLALTLLLLALPEARAQRFVKVVNSLTDLAATNPHDVYTNVFVVSASALFSYDSTNALATNDNLIKPTGFSGRWASKGVSVLHFKTAADLVAFPLPPGADKITAVVGGRVTENDGGGGSFTYDRTSSAATNSGLIFQPTFSPGRWLRLANPLIQDRAWFGDTLAKEHYLDAPGSSAGGFLIPEAPSRFTLTGGAELVGGAAWTARDSTAGILQVGDVNAIYYNSGLTPGNTYAPTLIAQGIGRSWNSSLIRQLNSGTMQSFGDSITAGQNATTAALRWVNRVSSAFNYALNNLAVGGSQLQDAGQTDAIYGTTVATNSISTLLSGVNNMRVYGSNTTMQQNYEDNLMAVCAYLAIPEYRKFYASLSWTLGGTWTNPNAYGLSRSRVSSVNGSSATASIYGRTIFIACTRTNSGGGTINVNIDSVDYGNFSCTGATVSPSGRTYSPFLIRIPNLTIGAHQVVVTVVGSSPAQLDWGAGSVDTGSLSGPDVYLGNCLRLDATGYASGPPYDQGSDNVVSQFNDRINRVATRLASDGLNVVYVDASTHYDPTTGISSDHIHPNDSGHAQIAEAFFQGMNKMIYPAQKQNAKTGVGNFDPITGYFGIGQVNPRYPIDAAGRNLIVGTVHVSKDVTDSGFYLMSILANNGIVAAGVAYDGANWVAKATSASILRMDGNLISAFNNTGLTAGNSFTPTRGLRFDTGLQVQSANTSPAGVGMELDYLGSTNLGSRILSYNRTAGKYMPQNIDSDLTTLNINGVVGAQLAASGLYLGTLSANKGVATDANTNLISVATPAGGGSMLLYQHQTASGSGGGALVSDGTFKVVPLTTEAVDADGHGSLSANQVTLDAGTYQYEYNVLATTTHATAALMGAITNYSDVNVITASYGTTATADPPGGTVSLISVGRGRFTIASSKTIGLIERLIGGDGSFGVDGGFGVNNVFSWIRLTKE